MRWTKRKARTLEQAIDDLFVFLGLSEEDKDKDEKALTPHRQKVSPRDFKEAEALIVSDDGSVAGVASDSSATSIFPDVLPRDVGDLDISVAKAYCDELGGRFIDLIRMKREPVRAARGNRLYSPDVASLLYCTINAEKGSYVGWKHLVNRSGSKWVTLGAHREYDCFTRTKVLSADGFCNSLVADNETALSDDCMVMLGMQFTRDVVWRVVFRSPTGISLSISTDTAGAMAAFRNREPNEKSGRRDALRHWVRQHYRERPVDEGDEPQRVIVRQHLRGRTPFRWLGIDCELVVSPFDIRRNERFKQERKALCSQS